jgi:hypothetical protein
MIKYRGLSYSSAPASEYQCEILPARLQLSEDYHHLRRILSQLSGILLLYRGATTNTLIGIEVTTREYLETLDEVVEHMGLVVLPDQIALVRAKCVQAARLLKEACVWIRDGLTTQGRASETAFDALGLLQRAHKLLAMVADDRAGMPMVSYCNCCAGVGLHVWPRS